MAARIAAYKWGNELTVSLTRVNKTAIQATAQTAADKESPHVRI